MLPSNRLGASPAACRAAAGKAPLTPKGPELTMRTRHRYTRWTHSLRRERQARALAVFPPAPRARGPACQRARALHARLPSDATKASGRCGPRLNLLPLRSPAYRDTPDQTHQKNSEGSGEDRPSRPLMWQRFLRMAGMPGEPRSAIPDVRHMPRQRWVTNELNVDSGVDVPCTRGGPAPPCTPTH